MEVEESPAAAATAATKMKEEMEAEITKAMLSRLDDFKQQADNLTMEGVRRALEKDLGMERLSLDAYKKFIKQCLEKYFYGADGKNASETEGKIAAEPAQTVKEVLQPDKDPRSGNSDRNENLEGSPALGEQGQPDHGTEKSHNSSEHGSEINEDMIKKAIKKRVPYFRSNLEITLGKVRCLLEEDLKLEKNSLDPFKKFVSTELDVILEEEVAVQATNGAKKESKKASSKRVAGKPNKGAKRPTKVSGSSDSVSDSTDSDDVLSDDEEEKIIKPKKRPAQKSKADTKGSKRQKISVQKSKTSGPGKKKPVEEDSDTDSDSDSDSSDSDDVPSDDEEEKIIKPKKQPAQKSKADTKGSKRQKISAQKSKTSGPGKKKPVEVDSEKSDKNDGEESSENERSQSSGAEEEVKKKSEKPAQVYGKRVEHLKSTIKSCGMGVPPSVYKRVNQAPESKREAHLIKELEEILEKEGLSTDPSEKEIKAVKKRKERAKELEGIDMSNIVPSSRRRSTSSYIPPPKPKIEAESDEDEEGEEGDEDSEEGDDEGEDSSEGSDADDAEEESD